MTMSTLCGYVHDALFYRSDDELLTAAVPFLSEGLVSDETVLIECRPHINRLLLAALDDDPRVVVFPRPGSSGRPAQTIAWYQETLQAEVDTGGGKVRGVGEVDFGKDPADWTEWARFESALNEVLAPYPLWGVCMYDTRTLPDAVLESGVQTHPNLMTSSGRMTNPRYVDPHEYLRNTRGGDPDPLESGPPHLTVSPLTDLADLRRRVHRACLAGSAVAKDAVAEFVDAVNEVTTHGFLHGKRPVEVRLWVTPERLVCRVTDHGRGFDDPLVGYRPGSGAGTEPGRGLWLARQLTDQVSLTRTADGFHVRLITECT